MPGTRKDSARGTREYLLTDFSSSCERLQGRTYIEGMTVRLTSLFAQLVGTAGRQTWQGVYPFAKAFRRLMGWLL